MTTLLRENFQKAVLITTRFVSLRPSLPVLNNIFLKSEKGALIFLVTNLETTIRIVMPAKTSENWETTVPAKMLSEFASNLGGSEVNLDLEKESLKISSSGTNAKLATISASEFPQTTLEQDSSGVEFSVSELYRAVQKVSFAASQDDGKPILNSIFLKGEDSSLALVATDGYRLAKQILKTKIEIKQLLVPARTFAEALKIANELEETEVRVKSDKNNNQLLVNASNFQISTRLVAGTYPDYKQIIPSNFITTITVNRSDLIAAIKTTAVFARDLGNVVTFEISSGKAVISATTAQIGDAKTQLEVDYSGEPLKVAFNSHYFNDGLAAIKAEKVQIGFSGQLSPALISAKEEPGFSYIVMPVKSQK